MMNEKEGRSCLFYFLIHLIFYGSFLKNLQITKTSNKAFKNTKLKRSASANAVCYN